MIERKIYPPIGVLLKYKIYENDLKIRKFLDYMCLPGGQGSAVLALDYFDNTVLIVIKRHPGNTGYQ